MIILTGPSTSFLINTYELSHTENPANYKSKIDYDILNIGKSYVESLYFNRPSSIKKAPVFGFCRIQNAKFTSLPENLFNVEGSDINKGYEDSIRDSNYYSKIVFSNCNSLKNIPKDLLKPLINLEDSIIEFNNCNAIESVPDELFKYNPKLKRISRSFL